MAGGRPVKTQEQDELNKRIGKRFQLIRKKILKVSQKEMAEEYNKTFVTVSNWETGTYSIPLEILKDVSDKTGINIEYLQCKTDRLNIRDYKILDGTISSVKYVEYLKKYCDELENEIKDLHEQIDNMYTHDQVQYAINRAAEDGRNGYGWGENIVSDYL